MLGRADELRAPREQSLLYHHAPPTASLQVDQMEAEAAVSKEMASTSIPQMGEERFKALESGGSVDDDLAAMKKVFSSLSYSSYCLPCRMC